MYLPNTKIRISTLLYVLLIISLLSVSAVNGNCNSVTQKTLLMDISELSFIEVHLAWKHQFDSTGVLDFLIKRCYAALPPQHQPHYKHILTFNHENKTISDVLKRFTGEDPSLLEISEVERGSTVYEKFENFLVNTAFLCEVTRNNEGWVGPAQPIITFHKTDGEVLKAYFHNCTLCQKGEIKLCSQEFSKYLLSLQIER